MANSIKVKFCNLPVECPALCENMREVQDQATGNWMTLCGESEEGTCNFSNESELQLLGSPPIVMT